jgi:hypothetical protein
MKKPPRRAACDRIFSAGFRNGWEPVSKGLPSEGGVSALEDDDRLPDKSDKKEEQDPTLTKVVSLAPLLAVILQAIELLLKWLGVIR